MTIIIIVCLLCAAWHFATRTVRIDDPAVVHVAVWLTASGTYLAFANELIAPNAFALLIIACGIISFSAGIWLGVRMPQLPLPEIGRSQLWLQACLFLLSALAFAAMLDRALSLVPGALDGRWLGALRTAVSADGKSFGIAAYLANLSFAAAAFALLTARGVSQSSLAGLTILMAIGCGIMLTGRTFLLLLITLLFISFVTRFSSRRTQLSAIAAVVTATLVLLALVTVLQGRSALLANDLISALQSEVLHYVPAGLAAFTVEVQNSEPLTWGLRTFRTFFAVLQRIGADVTVVPLVRPYVDVPFSTNVYTAASPYFSDFGIAGVVFAFFAFGAVTGFSYQHARSGQHPLAVILYGIMLYALILQPFQDQYMSLASQWVQLIAAVLLFSFATRISTWRRHLFAILSLLIGIQAMTSETVSAQSNTIVNPVSASAK